MKDSAICQAISDLRLLTFNYKRSIRTVEPHTLGYSKAGRLTLCAWQLTGGSGVGFRDFLVDEIDQPSVLPERFAGPRPGYSRNDTTMTRIICQL